MQWRLLRPVGTEWRQLWSCPRSLGLAGSHGRATGHDGSWSADADHAFADVVAGEEADEGLGCFLEAGHDVLGDLHLA